MTPAQQIAPQVSSISTAESQSTYNYALGYLRAFIVVLVVAHHTALAYHPYAPAIPTSLAAVPRMWQAFPVIDSQRGAWSALLVGFDDVFFMSLLFLLSGLFVANGIRTKGMSQFLRSRLLRLGLPFIAAVAVLAPLAYYPTYLQITHHSNVFDYARQWLSLGNWPSGPAWFIWVLFVFDLIAVLLFAWSPLWAENTGHFIAGTKSTPLRFFALLLAGSIVVYMPLAFVYGGISWTAFGPFTIQTARTFHYLLYFLAGVSIGALGIERGPFMLKGKLAGHWALWLAVSLLTFFLAAGVTVAFLTAHLQSKAWETAVNLTFPVCCAACCFGLLGLFLRFARSRLAFFDSLNRNSYGIFLLHYAFVTWLQLAMLRISIPTVAKFTIVFLLAVGGSWLTIIALRRIPAIARAI